MREIIIYGASVSPSVRAVLLTARTINLEFHYEPIDVFNQEHLTIEFMRMNPRHTVPVLDDNGFILCDAHAICQYLVDTYAFSHSLFPEDVKSRALINERLFFNSNILSPQLQQITFGLKLSQQTHEFRVKEVNKAYGILNKYLHKKKYVAGNIYTIADFNCLPTITSLDILIPIDNCKYPRVIRWIRRCATNWEFYKECQQVGQNLFYQTVMQNIDFH